MKLHALSACLAALALVAACDDGRTSSRTPSAPRVHAASAVSAPVAAAGPAAPAPPSATVPGQVPSPDPTVALDGGAGTEEPFDVLALEHTHRDGVDHLRRARTLRDEGDLAGAMAEVRRAVADDPQDTQALLQLAKLAGVVGDTSMMAEAWGRVAEQDHEDAFPAIQHARALIALKQYDLAAMSGLDAIERNPSSAEAQHITGRAYLSGGDLTAAISYFERALELQPDHGYALNNLGFAYLRANRNEEAVEVLQQAADLLPTVAYVQNNLGVALERTGRVDEAKGAYALASSLSPRYIKAQVNSARLRKVASAAAVAMPETEVAAETSSDEADLGSAVE